ncbi:hypothetical protein [Streptomyces sp. S.PNR 29]|uniref:hypothetical protein n=1 Tax=Streptomyces sp. S.PNR 29 TaxID=2973805 RepID=UPI0025B157C1|nr:hypothetical protein [Streptomyces sp. S.PNR 29]MDN0197425.1 hypothetical protein [Streptomyces sp. S.PNR 29]
MSVTSGSRTGRVRAPIAEDEPRLAQRAYLPGVVGQAGLSQQALAPRLAPGGAPYPAVPAPPAPTLCGPRHAIRPTEDGR